MESDSFLVLSKVNVGSAFKSAQETIINNKLSNSFNVNTADFYFIVTLHADKMYLCLKIVIAWKIIPPQTKRNHTMFHVKKCKNYSLFSGGAVGDGKTIISSARGLACTVIPVMTGGSTGRCSNFFFGAVLPKTGNASILSNTSHPSSRRPNTVCKLFKCGCRS